MRHDRRPPDALRPIKIKRRFTRAAPGSVLIQAGRTGLLCTASIDPGVPAWLAGQGRGWLTAEYSMLPGSTKPRKRRERGANVEGRTSEIQRLIGRSLRAVIDLAALGERTITLDCDVLEADGGTRTLAISGGFIALVDALRTIQKEPARPGSPAAAGQRGSRERGTGRGPSPARFELRGGFCRGGGHERRDDRLQPLRRDPRDRRRGHLHRRRACRNAGLGP